MSRTLCRGLIATAAILVAMLASQPARAQVPCRPGYPCEPGGFYNNTITGVQYDLMNQAHAAKQLRHVESKLSRSAAQHPAAAARDVRRIARLEHRMMVNDWLIRYNSCQELTPYPHSLCLDPITAAVLSRPSLSADVAPIYAP